MLHCGHVAINAPLRVEELSAPVKLFHFAELAADVAVTQCFEVQFIQAEAGTGAAQWNAGLQLALYIAGHYTLGSGKALELGAGLGLVSIVLSLLGFETIATDGDPNILSCAVANLEANTGPNHRWSVQELQW